MGAQSTGRKITKKHKYLRLVLRRKPCFFISLFEIGLLLLLIGSFVGLYFGYNHVHKQRLTLDREDIALKNMHNKIIFAHCTYKPLTAPLPDDFPGPGNFSLKYCNLKSRVHAFAYRHYRLEKEEDTCIDRHEQVDCHESLTKMRETSFWKIDISKKCIGVAGEPFKTDRHHVGAIPVDGILNHNNEIVHSSELIFYCPKCTAKSKPFSINSECYKSVATLANGWPSAFYNCDDFTSIDNHECGG